MQTLFDKIFIGKAEYSATKSQNASDQIKYLFDIFDATSKQTRSIDLAEFFTDVQRSLEQYHENILVESHDVVMPSVNNDAMDFVDVMIDDHNIMIESNSLRAVRHVTNKFIESGYILQRDFATEKMFRKDKTTRYIRIYRIINFINSMCLN